MIFRQTPPARAGRAAATVERQTLRSPATGSAHEREGDERQVTAATPVPAAEPPPGQLVGHWPLAPEPRSARLARRLVAQLLGDVEEQVRRRVLLVTSELVGNGVRHARGGLQLTLHRYDGGWVVAVSDDSPAPPVVHAAAGSMSESGRGLMIVQRISGGLGWARTPTGKVVWAYLPDPP